MARTRKDWQAIAVAAFELAERIEEVEPLSASEIYAKATAAASIAATIPVTARKQNTGPK